MSLSIFHSTLTYLALFAITSVQSYVPFFVPSLDDQCVERGFGGACELVGLPFDDDLTCPSLYCAYNIGICYAAVNTGPALENTRCKHNGVCRNGRCVTVHPAEVPQPDPCEGMVTCTVLN